MPADDVRCQWFTGLAKIVNAHEGVITEGRPNGGVYGSQSTFEVHPFHKFDRAVSEHWVAFRKDPTNHAGRALSVVRLDLPTPVPGWTHQKTRAAHRPPPPYKGRVHLPFLSLTDSLPTVQTLFRRYYGSSGSEPSHGKELSNAGSRPTAEPSLALDLAYAGSPGDPPPEQLELSRFSGIKCKAFPLAFGFANLHKYGRICETGPSYPYGGQAVWNIYRYATGILIVLILFRGGMVWWYYKWYLIRVRSCLHYLTITACNACL